MNNGSVNIFNLTPQFYVIRNIYKTMYICAKMEKYGQNLVVFNYLDA